MPRTDYNADLSDFLERMTAVVTCCPHCHTRFRVSEAQLAMAGGLVRCGQCLTVFNAGEQTRDPPAAPEAAPARSPELDDQALSALIQAEQQQVPVREPAGPEALAGPGDTPEKVPQDDPPLSSPLPEQEMDPGPDEPGFTEYRPGRFAIEDDLSLACPLQPPPARASRRPAARTGLLVAGLLLGTALGYLLASWSSLARDEQLRPWLDGLCSLAGCELPAPVDLGRLKSTNLVVRRHPDFSGALVADAILYNRAPFAQPFPVLELRFTDVNSQPVTTRRYRPAEYLPAGLQHQLMPSQTPVHVQLDMLDPGEHAVNYSLDFLPAP